MEAIHVAPLLEAAIADVVPLVQAFREELGLCSASVGQVDAIGAEAELHGYLEKQYPVYVLWLEEHAAGYAVARVEDETVWLESFYVLPEVRRQGLGSLLFATVEELAAVLGEETVNVFVHPQNDAMLAFLQAHGYDVLNLLEVRKPLRQETAWRHIDVGGTAFRT